jgi:hypothetical protein
MPSRPCVIPATGIADHWPKPIALRVDSVIEH